MSSKKTTTKTVKVARDAGSGQFVTKAFADAHKKTTVVETVRQDTSKRRK
jgi:hypothetical protein